MLQDQNFVHVIRRGMTLTFLSHQPNYWAHLPILVFWDSIMAGKALSEHIKKQKQSYLKEEKLQKVVDAYCDEQTSEPHTQKGA